MVWWTSWTTPLTTGQTLEPKHLDFSGPHGVRPFRRRWPGIGRRNADEVDSPEMLLPAATTGHRPRKHDGRNNHDVDLRFLTSVVVKTSWPVRQPLPRVPTGQFAAGCTPPRMGSPHRPRRCPTPTSPSRPSCATGARILRPVMRNSGRAEHATARGGGTC